MKSFFHSVLPFNKCQCSRRNTNKNRINSAKISATPFGINRWVLLLSYVIVNALTAYLYLGWAKGLQDMLFRSGAYAWVCSSEAAAIADYLPRCDQQQTNVGNLVTVSLVTSIVSSVFAGTSLDFLGPKITATAGILINLSGWVLLAESNEGLVAYIPAMILIGMGCNFSTMSIVTIARLFPERRRYIIAIATSSASFSMFVMVTCNAIWKKNIETLSFRGILWGYVAVASCVALPIVVLLLPWKAFAIPKVGNTSGTDNVHNEHDTDNGNLEHEQGKHQNILPAFYEDNNGIMVDKRTSKMDLDDNAGCEVTETLLNSEMYMRNTANTIGPGYYNIIGIPEESANNFHSSNCKNLKEIAHTEAVHNNDDDDALRQTNGSHDPLSCSSSAFCTSSNSPSDRTRSAGSVNSLHCDERLTNSSAMEDSSIYVSAVEMSHIGLSQVTMSSCSATSGSENGTDTSPSIPRGGTEVEVEEEGKFEGKDVEITKNVENKNRNSQNLHLPIPNFNHAIRRVDNTTTKIAKDSTDYVKENPQLTCKENISYNNSTPTTYHFNDDEQKAEYYAKKKSAIEYYVAYPSSSQVDMEEEENKTKKNEGDNKKKEKIFVNNRQYTEKSPKDEKRTTLNSYITEKFDTATSLSTDAKMYNNTSYGKTINHKDNFANVNIHGNKTSSSYNLKKKQRRSRQ